MTVHDQTHHHSTRLCNGATAVKHAARVLRGILLLTASFLITSTSSVLSTPLSKATAPPNILTPFEAKYSIRSSAIPFEGKITRALRQNQNGEWEAHTHAKAFASSVEENSRFTLQDCDVKSQHFYYKRTVFGKKKFWSLHFDWPNKRVTYTLEKSDDQHPPLAIETASLADRLSEQFSVQCHVSRGEASFTLPAIHKDKVSIHHYQIVGEELLETPNGKLSTIKVIKQHENPERITTVWLAPSYRYLMVRLIQKDDDETLRVEIKQFPKNEL